MMIYISYRYERIKTDKTEQDWSFNQFAVHASKYFA